jgi:AAA+ superfamily predicted ATPase
MNSVEELDYLPPALREAIRFSPENVPLRLHAAEVLTSQGNLAGAELAYRQALALDPQNDDLQLGLARVFYEQKKDSAAFVIVERLLDEPSPPARACALHARLLLRAGQFERAGHAYRTALDIDPSAADPTLAEQLGVLACAGDPNVPPREALRVAAEDPDAPLEGALERPTISFQDVGGMDAVKEEIRMKIIYPLSHPELFEAYGKKTGGGILMYGPPGCGKTYLARATAGEIRATFLPVGINDVLEMWMGSSERNLHSIFVQARRHRPCVLFFDEVDALGASRSDLRHTTYRHVINQFLMELDGVASNNEGLLVLAATNAPWHLDSAFRRPGRFDRVLFVPPPDAPAREAILRLLLHGKPVTDVNYAALAKRTDGYSGADLKGIVDVAVEAKLRDAMKRGNLARLTTADLLAAAKSQGPTIREWFATARNYALFCNEGGAYDDVLSYVQAGKY